MNDSTATARDVIGACPHDCPDNCSMIYTVEDGRLTGVRGNPDHPFTRGRLCVKVKDYDRHHYNPDRLLHPMRRTGLKGSGQFERVSWEAALDEIRDRWNAIIAEHGAEAILPFGYAGNLGLLNGMNSGDAFFNRLGASIGEKTFCASGSVTSQLLTVGPTLGTDPESFVHARYIVLWGANTISTTSHLWPFVLAARKRGAKVIVVDPYRTRTAAQADWHIPIRPGTDGALALAMMHTLIEEDLIDRDYVERHTVGFEALRDRASRFSPDAVAAVTGLAAEDIRRFAREYAQRQPSVIRLGVAPERHPGGAQGMRAIGCLPALVGAWRHVGGGILQMPIFVPVRFERLSRPDWIRPGTRVINLLKAGEALTGRLDLDPPIRSVFVWNTNPVSQVPDANRVVEGLAREDLFTVVSEQFLTDTARYADILLPAAMEGELTDIVTSWGHFYINFNRQAVAPPGETVSNVELFRRLAGAMGFDDEHFRQTDEEMLERAIDWDAPMLRGYSYEMLKERGFLRVQVGHPDRYAPHAEGNFPTPSGKCELLSSGAARGNFVAPVLRQLCEADQSGGAVDPLPGFETPAAVPAANAPAAPAGSLHLLTPKSHGFINSEYANEPHKLRGQGGQFILLHPDDARARGIADGDRVRVHNARGEFPADARVTDDVRPGLAVASYGYWPSLNGGGAVNATTSAGELGLGGAPASFHNTVTVSRIDSD
jgi:anaerobic selenocysteine-containing dehydrogenase